MWRGVLCSDEGSADSTLHFAFKSDEVFFVDVLPEDSSDTVRKRPEPASGDVHSAVQFGSLPEPGVIRRKVFQDVLAPIAFSGEDGNQVRGLPTFVVSKADCGKLRRIKPLRLIADVYADVAIEEDHCARWSDDIGLRIAHCDDESLIQTARTVRSEVRNNTTRWLGISGLGLGDVGFSNCDGEDLSYIHFSEDFGSKFFLLKILSNLDILHSVIELAFERDNFLLFRQT